MAGELIYPTATELYEIEQEIAPRLLAGRLGIQMLPIVPLDSHIVEWEQKDLYGGMQQLRGLNGEPRRVKMVASKKFMYNPGVYGEFIALDETKLTKRRRMLGTFNTPVSTDDLVREAQEQLLVRRYNRIEWIDWQLFLYGQFVVPADFPGGYEYRGEFDTQTFTRAVAWTDHANATPLADLRAMALLSRGKGVSFDQGAMFVLNRVMANHMLANTNLNDLGGYRKDHATSMNSIEGVNVLLSTAGIPTVSVYDEGDFDEAGTFSVYIPNNKAVLFGRRLSGTPYGKYAITWNANHPSGASEPYTIVNDSFPDVPRTVEVHDGHNGGPLLEFPGSIVSCNL